MVLVANRSTSNSNENCQSDGSGPPKKEIRSNGEAYEVSDILMTPKLLENDNGCGTTEGIQVGTAAPLSAVHQAVILAKCLVIEKSTRRDDMQSKSLKFL